jgi:hypothetical protein|tara:strand:+ start:2279 stop:2842 length:564 start_codon:yes stop_codon:yes gene_type:complete
MASNIVPGNIDGTYPTAGQDNSSQGFRDNFTGIKNNFTEARVEIDAIQSNKANLNASNDFTGNIISNGVLKDNAETVYAHGSVSSGSVTLNHENGHYQTLTITADTTFAFINFPAGALGRIILDITVAPSSTGILTFPSAVVKADNVTGSDGTSDTVTIGIGRALFEFMSPDTGTTVLMHQLGKQYA